MAETSEDSGGFFPPSQTQPSPAPSNSSTSSNSHLPHPRAKSLQPGSNKEDTVRRFVDQRLALIARKYVKKFSIPEEGDEIVGYKTFGELCKDLHTVIDVIWLSGTPSLQIPFLLNIASEFTRYIVSFPPSPVGTFSVLRKLDHCFASLLCGEDIDTKETLPGYENGLRAGMTTTDMVRCRSSVEQTRLLVTEVLSRDPEEVGEDSQAAEESEASMEGGGTRTDWDEDDDRLHMDVARVYENTIVHLGERLGDSLLEGSQNG